MASFNFKRLTPHLLIVLLFAVFALVYNYPALQGMKLNQHDHISWLSMSKEARDYYEKTGNNPLWSNSMFGGMPTYTTYYAKSNNAAGAVSEVVQKIIVKPAYFFFIAMLGFYILMMTMRANRWLAAIGAMAYAFTSYNTQIIAAGHDTKMLAIGYMPAVLAGFLMLMKGRFIAGSALMAFFMALLLSTNHFQMVYYTFIILGFIGLGYLVRAIKEGTVKTFAVGTAFALGATLLGLAPNAASIMGTKEYDAYSMRSGKSELTKNNKTNKGTGGLDKEYAFRWSNGVGEVLCMMVPNLYGGGSREDLGTSSNLYEKLVSIGMPEQNAEQFVANAPTYWGPQPFLSGPTYFGAIICFLFVLAMMALRSPHKWWILAVSLLGIFMSMGKHFAGLNYLLFDTLPLLNKFRTPSMILIIPQLMFAMSAVWVLNEIIQGKYDKDALWKHIKWAAIGTAGLCLILGLGAQMFFDFKTAADQQLVDQLTQSGATAQMGNDVVSALRDDRASMAMMSGLRSALFILLSAAVLWAYNKKSLSTTTALAALGLLIAIDLLPIAHKYLNEEHYVDADTYESFFAPSAADMQIKQDPDPFYRVLDVSRDTYNDAIPALHHHLIGGYHPAKMEIYQDLIENHMSQANGNFNASVLNMLNTKYFIFPGGNGQPVAQKNPDALGNAWFVNEIKWVNTADEEMDALKGPKIGDTAIMTNGFNAAQTAVIRNTFKGKLGSLSPAKDSAALIKLTKYDLMDMQYESNNNGEGVAVFSDIWYPAGWNAYVDDKPTEIIRANYVLRALKLPAGKHKINFRFEPKAFATGMTIAMIGSVLLLLLCGWAMYNVLTKKENNLTAQYASGTVPVNDNHEAMPTSNATKTSTKNKKK